MSAELEELSASMKVSLLQRQIEKLIVKVAEQHREIESLKAEKQG